MKIYPIAATMVSWKDFVDLSKESLGYSPTRGLDENKIELTNASAFVSCLDFKNKPKECLTLELNPVFQHVYYSFMGDLGEDMFWIFQGGITATSVESRKKTRLAILTGSLFNWYLFTIMHLTSHYPEDFEIRSLANQVMLYLEMAGYKSVWAKWVKKSQNDGTFLLEKK